MTLLFLGSVDPGYVPELQALVDEAAAAHAPYRVRADAGDGRARHGEGVGWLGLGDGAGQLIAVATDVAGRCRRDITAGPPPKRTPSAHLTVVRKANEGVIEALRSREHGPLGVDWTVDRISLVRSHLDPDGARYETVHQSTM